MKKKIFWSGVLRPLKNIEFILKLCGDIKRENLNFKMIFAGKFISDNYQNKIKDMVNKLDLENNVSFLGYINRKELNEVLKIIDINILPSSQEVCPMSVLEAMTFSKPTISFNVGGLSDLIQSNFNGILVDKNDFSSFKNNLIKLINDNDFYSFLAKNCYEKSHKYTIDEIAHKNFSFYNKILKNNG